MDFSPILISLKTTLIATFFTFFLGMYAARFVARLHHCRGLIDGLFTLPMVLPPTVVGFFLLLFIGKNSLLGQFLLHFNITLVFSWEATVISATVVSFPLMYRTALGAFEQIDKNILYAARTLGMTESKIFWRIVVPNSFSGIASGTILAFARALGEFGATIMIAGNIPGRTQTVSTAIYSAMQAGDWDRAYQWVIVVMVISFSAMLLMNGWSKRQRKYDAKKT